MLARAISDPSASLNEQAAVVAYDSTTYGMTQKVSTLRFSSFSVNYRAPQHIARLLRAQGVSIGLQGSNLGLHSTYSGKDPNVSAWTPTEQIVDTGQLPMPRTWQLRLNLTY